ncbi:putative surface antigen protein 2 [Leptomonas pyrrhocoris]|uniref:Putative surface antigen protein 2 n=1 Tax=Leptomonas pyrrhocoris TaxID=157538 RepID=A0A0M9FZ84_LEPPY|nr:putative surface antigen protein 2 [Leptomonas pyrrhocoris]KPA78896.1 putative surface antigen protein 2 [Leptomonas pyrrhocoris]|eukprot:XP_015657335.1 putative surface antigen protein 2 [Leptomonas pyrrhocoris]
MRSADSYRMLMLAALAVALIVSTVVAGAAPVSVVTTHDFTEAQRINTLKVLEALSPAVTKEPVHRGSSDFCTWPGVLCHRLRSGDVGAEVTVMHDSFISLPVDVQRSEVRITSLKVRANALAKGSTLLSDLAMATSSSALTVLDFTGSNISSELPPTWGRFVSLQYLRLGDNHFYGTLPTAWSALTSLKEFQLQNNDVTGTLPAAWRTMTQMRNITLDNNTLAGMLPPSWSSMTSLSILSLKGNNFCGGVPASWAGLTGLALTADDTFYSPCRTLPPTSSNSDSRATPSSSANGTSTTLEPPAVLTNCTATHCVLCPVTAPSRCAACMPGYALTSTWSCVSHRGDVAYGPARLWPRVVATCAVLVAAAVSTL